MNRIDDENRKRFWQNSKGFGNAYFETFCNRIQTRRLFVKFKRRHGHTEGDRTAQHSLFSHLDSSLDMSRTRFTTETPWGKSKEDSDHFNMNELKSEFERVTSIHSLVKDITTCQINEQLHCETWIASKKPSGHYDTSDGDRFEKMYGDFVRSDHGCHFFTTIFPDLGMGDEKTVGNFTDESNREQATDKRNLELAHLLICRLKYYLATLESYMMIMIPLGQGDEVLKLNYDGIEERHRVSESDALHCQEIVRSLQMAKLGPITEIIVGMLALHPLDSFESPRSRAETFSTVLQTFRTLVLRYELIGASRKKSGAPSIIANKLTMMRYVYEFARLIPLPQTLYKLEVESSHASKSLMIKLCDHDRYCWSSSKLRNKLDPTILRSTIPEFWGFETPKFNAHSVCKAIVGAIAQKNASLKCYQLAGSIQQVDMKKASTSELMWSGWLRLPHFEGKNKRERDTHSATRHARFNDALRCLLYILECQYHRPIVVESPNHIRGENEVTVHITEIEVALRENDRKKYKISSPKIHGLFECSSSKCLIVDVELVST